MDKILFSSKANYRKAASMSLLGAIFMAAICVLFLYPSEPLLNLSPLRRLLTAYPAHRETAVAVLAALGSVAMAAAFFLADAGVRFLFSSKSEALVVTPQAIKIPTLFMRQEIIIPIEHINSIKISEHAIEVDYNSVTGRKVIEVSRMYDRINDFASIVQRLIAARAEPVTESFSVSLNKTGLSEQEALEKVAILSALLNKSSNQIQAGFKGDFFLIRKGLIKDQAAKIIAQLKARGVPVSVSKDTKQPPLQPKSKLPRNFTLIVPASLAGILALFIPGGLTLWVFAMWLALNQLPQKLKLNALLVLAAITLEFFINAMPQEAPSVISSLSIWIFGLSGISLMMRNNISKTYNISPNILLTFIVPIFYVNYTINKLIIERSKN